MHGHGTTIEGANAGTIGKVTNIDIGDDTIDALDVSNMDSPNKAREFEPGMEDAGEVSVSARFAKAHRGTVALKKGLADSWTITYPDGSKHEFDGFINKISDGVPYDSDITYDFSIKVSGPITFTPAA